MSARPRLLLALLWLGILLLAGWWLGGHLQLSGDLRKFMPDPETPAQKLLIDELGEGPGSRLLLVALSGESRNWKVILPDDAASTWAFSGFVTNYAPGEANADEGVLTGDIEIMPDGETFTPPASA